MKTGARLLVLMVLCGALVLAGCDGQATETVPPEEVPVATDGLDVVVAEAVVEPARWIELCSASTGGKVVDVAVTEGEVVSGGDLLLRFDQRDAELDIEQAEAAVAKAEAQVMRVAATATPEEIALGELTICLGQEQNPDGWFRTLRNLNPRLEPGERIEAGREITVPSLLVPVYEKNCRGGEILERARVLFEANYPDEPEMIVYTVRRGDTLGRIASRFRCAGVRELAAINNIRPPRYVIRPGQRIKVPPCR